MFLVWMTRRTSLSRPARRSAPRGSGPCGKGFDRLPPVWQMAAILSIAMIEGGVMPKEEWGVKRVCPTTGKRFYDLGRDPIVSPYTGEVVELDTGKGGRALVSEKPSKPRQGAEGNRRGSGARRRHRYR
jgi:hypothetical protein